MKLVTLLVNYLLALVAFVATTLIVSAIFFAVLSTGCTWSLGHEQQSTTNASLSHCETEKHNCNGR